MTSDVETLWEYYWRDLPKDSGAAFWDSGPLFTAARHIPLFQPYFDPGLPLVDLGCGNGTQTRYLAGRFDRVIGVDIADAAIEAARAAGPEAEYRRMDLLDTADVDALHAETGDVNIYVRGVLHQIPPDGLNAAFAGIARLLGGRGHMFCQELTPHTASVLGELAVRPGGPPPKLAHLLAYFPFVSAGAGPRPELAGQLAGAGFDVLAAGSIDLRTTESRPDGTPLDIPTSYVIARTLNGARHAS